MSDNSTFKLFETTTITYIYIEGSSRPKNHIRRATFACKDVNCDEKTRLIFSQYRAVCCEQKVILMLLIIVNIKRLAQFILLSTLFAKSISLLWIRREIMQALFLFSLYFGGIKHCQTFLMKTSNIQRQEKAGIRIRFIHRLYNITPNINV